MNGLRINAGSGPTSVESDPWRVSLSTSSFRAMFECPHTQVSNVSRDQVSVAAGPIAHTNCLDMVLLFGADNAARPLKQFLLLQYGYMASRLLIVYRVSIKCPLHRLAYRKFEPYSPH